MLDQMVERNQLCVVIFKLCNAIYGGQLSVKLLYSTEATHTKGYQQLVKYRLHACMWYHRA